MISCVTMKAAAPLYSHLSLRALIGIGVVAALGGALGGCGKDVKGTSEQSGAVCNLSEEQRGSYMPKISATLPIRVLVDDRFNADQRGQISHAIAVWNAFFSQSRGHNIFRAEITQVQGPVQPEFAEDCGFQGSSGEVFAILKSQGHTQWEALGLSENNPAATLRCNRGEELVKQVVLINTEIVHPKQVMSATLHELGHAVGLNHSCAPSHASTDYLSCSGLATDHPYRQAVMFPTLRLVKTKAKSSSSSGGSRSDGIPELKEDLRRNDKERTQCLYSGA